MKYKMKTTEYSTQIAVYNIGVKLVVPGYTSDGKMGYFVCEQKKIKSRNTIKYQKITHFFPYSEDALQQAIDAAASFDDV